MIYDRAVELIAETVAVLRKLDIPEAAVHSIDVKQWHGMPVSVSIHVSGRGEVAVPMVDRIGDHYDLPPDKGVPDGNYYRGGHLGESPVHVFCAAREDR